MMEEDMVNYMKEMLESAAPHGADECCIYKVPLRIRRLNEDAYTPKVVSIGPFHHNSHPRLHNMERHKLIFCKAFLQRTNTTLDSWIRYIQEVEPNFRRCYSDTLEFTKEELIKIIFVDSGFIFELFLRTYYDEWSENDTFHFRPWLAIDITLDLLLLENQLPFFVLEDLFNLSYSSRSATGNNKIPSFIEFTFNYFAFLNRSNVLFHNVRIRHFTDLLRTFHLQYPPQRRPIRRNMELVMQLPSATELLEAGVRIKGNTDNCLLNLRFLERVLAIPKLIVEDSTEFLFRNMLALELCHYPHESFITDYVFVLGLIGKTSRDVDILTRQRVLVNFLGDNDCVASMFHDLYANIIHTTISSDYVILCKELDAFCINPWHRWMAAVRRWQGAASIAGVFLLFLTLLQSVCSVLQVVPLKK